MNGKTKPFLFIYGGPKMKMNWMWWKKPLHRQDTSERQQGEQALAVVGVVY